MPESVEVSATKLEPKVPETRGLGMEKVLYVAGKLTNNSAIARKGQRSERSRDLRGHRADIYKQVLKTKDRNRRREYFDIAHARDEIESQYLSQGEVTVDSSELGQQTARYITIEPPSSRKKPEYSGKPTIVFIPGISNDLDSVANLIKEIPFQGRNVLTISMPDSKMGRVTAAFAEAVQKSTTVQPHAEFLKAAINSLVGKDQQIELWGLSGGAMIASEILNDPEFQQRTKDAVLLSPAGTAEQSINSQNYGVAREDLNVMPSLNRSRFYSLVNGRNELQPVKPEEDVVNTDNSFKAFREKTLHVFPLYETMQVQDGGKIVVVSGMNDRMTKSHESDNKFRQHSQVDLITLPNGIHNTPIVEAETIVPRVLSTLNS